MKHNAHLIATVEHVINETKNRPATPSEWQLVRDIYESLLIK